MIKLQEFNSYIEFFHAKNVGLFEELNIEFNRKFNFIIGPNGSGKTSIFRCIGICLDPPESAYFSRYGNNAEIWIDFSLNNKRYRLGAGKGFIERGNIYRKARFYGLSGDPPEKRGYKSINVFQLEKSNIYFSPLIIGAYRKIGYKRISGMQREESPKVQRQHYRANAVKYLEGIIMPDVKQWMINRYFQIDKKWADIITRNWEWLLKNMKYLGPSDVKFDFIDIQKDLEPIFSLNGVSCYLEELSAGYQSILSLILTVFNWVEDIYDGNNRVVENTSGTVIIDELDVHMHPEWQFTIRRTLEKLFPQIQFILSTHSPHLIATAESNEIIILPQFSRIINVKPTNRIYSGWSTDQILEDLMGVKSLENKFYSKLYKKALEYIDKKNIEALKDVISTIEKITHPSDTTVERLKIKLASLTLDDNS